MALKRLGEMSENLAGYAGEPMSVEGFGTKSRAAKNVNIRDGGQTLRGVGSRLNSNPALRPGLDVGSPGRLALALVIGLELVDYLVGQGRSLVLLTFRARLFWKKGH